MKKEEAACAANIKELAAAINLQAATISHLEARVMALEMALVSKRRRNLR